MERRILGEEPAAGAGVFARSQVAHIMTRAFPRGFFFHGLFAGNGIVRFEHGALRRRCPVQTLRR